MIYILFLYFSVLHVSYELTDLVQVGDSSVLIHQQKSGRGKTFVHLHQNETTALKAARTVVDAEGGRLLTLIHDGGRNITFSLHGARFEFDPNRIFSDVGIKKTLLQFGEYTEDAHREVKKLADKIKELLPKGKIIAVHNNETYSLLDYFPGHELACDAQALHINQGYFYRNFYLVTQQYDYLRLKELKFNTIWQAVNAVDDGSLSIFLSERSYINVEAGYDQLEAQIDMLNHS